MINKIKEMYKQQGISEQVYDFSEKICADLEERFKKVDKIAEYNQLKVSAESWWKPTIIRR